MFTSATPQRPVLFDSNGDKLVSGYVYFYEQGTTNAKTVYSDTDRTTPITVQVRTDADGRISQQVILGEGAYTIQTFESDNATLANEWDQYGETSASAATTATNVDIVDDLRGLSVPSAGTAYLVMGYYANGDMYPRLYTWDATDVNDDNGGTIVKITGVSTGSFIHDPGPVLDARVFGFLPGTSANANTYLTNAVSWCISNIGNTRTVSLVSGVYACVGDYTQTVNCGLIIEDGVQFNNTTTATTYTLKPTQFIEIKKQQNIESSGSTGSVVLDLTAEQYAIDANPIWYGADPANTAAVNTDIINSMDTLVNRFVFTEDYTVSGLALNKDVVFNGGSLRSTPSTSFFYGSVSGETGSFISDSFRFAKGEPISLSWFDDGSAIEVILARVDECTGSLNNTILWDVGTDSIPAFTQSGTAPFAILGGAVLTATGAVSVSRVESSNSGVLSQSTGSWTFSDANYVELDLFSDVAYGIECAENSELVATGNGGSYALSGTISITDDLKVWDATFTNAATSSTSFAVTGVSKTVEFKRVTIDNPASTTGLLMAVNSNLKLVNCDIDLLNVADGSASVESTYINNGCALAGASMVGGGVTSGNMIISDNTHISGAVFTCDLVRLAGTLGGIRNISLNGCTVNCSKASAVETGYIEFYTDVANTVVKNVNLQGLTFVGSADATFEVIQKTLSGSGTWFASGSSHQYKSEGHTVGDADMVASSTVVLGSGVESLNGTLGLFNGNVSTDANFLEFSGDASIWHYRASWSKSVGGTEQYPTGEFYTTSGAGFALESQWSGDVTGQTTTYTYRYERLQ
jgi:hypothetical protein